MNHSVDKSPDEQIGDASLLIARRLVSVLERTPLTGQVSQVEAGARLITSIRREVADLLQASPGNARVQAIAVARLAQALDFLEVLEGTQRAAPDSRVRVASPAAPQPAPQPSPPPPDPLQASRALADLIAVARGPAADRTPGSPASAPLAPQYAAPSYPYPPPDMATQPGEPSYPVGGQAVVAQRAPTRTNVVARPPGAGEPSRAGLLQRLRSAPVHAASLVVVTVFVSTVFAIASFLLRPDNAQDQAAGPATAGPLATGRPSSRLYETAAGDMAPDAAPSRRDTIVVTPPPARRVRIVLSTRPTSEEALAEFRALQASYPALLANAEARVDAVPLANNATWHRLSLAEALTPDAAKARCAALNKAGFTRCWLKPVAPPDI